MKMPVRSSLMVLALLVGAGVPASARERTVMVGGAAMLPDKTIVENAAASRDHTTLVSAIKSAGLVETLNGPGPFTVFAPTNAAFQALPAGRLDALLQPQNHDQLVKLLTYHVIAGRMTTKDIERAIRAGRGNGTLTTVQGETISASMAGGRIVLRDARGGTAMVTVADVGQSNGVIHVVDTVMMP